MYGKVMSVPDKAMPIFHKLVLGWGQAQLNELESGLADGSLHPNEVKMNLSREIVGIFHSPDDAIAAQKRWDEVFRSGNKSAIPEDIPEEVLEEEDRVINILRNLKMVGSGREAKDLIKNNGIRRDGEPVSDAGETVKPEELPVVLQVGKRKFVRLIGK